MYHDIYMSKTKNKNSCKHEFHTVGTFSYELLSLCICMCVLACVRAYAMLGCMLAIVCVYVSVCVYVCLCVCLLTKNSETQNVRTSEIDLNGARHTLGYVLFLNVN